MFRMIGNLVEIYRFRITYATINLNQGDNGAEAIGEVDYAVSEEHRDAILASHPGAKAEALDVSDIEWLDGLTFDSYEDAEKALERKVYLPKRTVEQLQADIDYIAIMTGVEL